MCGRLHINADLSVIQKHPKNLHGSADTEGSADHSLPPLFISLNQGEHWRERWPRHANVSVRRKNKKIVKEQYGLS